MTTTFDTYERIHVERNGIVPMRLPAGEAFPLFQPEGERRWVAGWEPRYVHPAEPAVGEGVVFQTTTREGTATWVQTRFEPTTHEASYVYIVPGHRATTVHVAVTPTAEDRSQVHVTYRMTALSPHADDFVRGFGDGFGEYLVQWERAIRRHIVDCVPMGNEIAGP